MSVSADYLYAYRSDRLRYLKMALHGRAIGDWSIVRYAQESLEAMRQDIEADRKR